jgi:hypothetical protein
VTSKYSGPREALAAARDPDASIASLRELATSEWPFVRAAVAKHPTADAELLRSLTPRAIAHERDAGIAQALAEHPRTPAEALGALAGLALPYLGEPRENRWAFALGVALSRHPSTPWTSVRPLLESSRAVTQFRKVVARESHRADVLALLAADRSETVRRAASRTGQGAA